MEESLLVLPGNAVLRAFLDELTSTTHLHKYKTYMLLNSMGVFLLRSAEHRRHAHWAHQAYKHIGNAYTHIEIDMAPCRNTQSEILTFRTVLRLKRTSEDTMERPKNKSQILRIRAESQSKSS